ncbi:MAG: exodeoxyribonuclease V subunit gamma, partial [Geobacter sp.]|nr:exodeoxyribonuclease V subunit gamma [Geobacter sp.]
MPLNIIKSNRMEKLLDAAAERLSRPLAGPPLTPETVILQSRGMQRWFSIEMARRFGIWANVAYPFPNRFVADLFKLVLPETEPGEGYAPELICWRLMQILPPLLDREEFAPVRQYLSGANPELRLYQLCGQIADLFDQYTLFRGAMLTEWEKGRGDGWQPLLWRELTASTKGEHREALRRLLLKKLRASGAITALPERISLFGISTLPPYHMDIFAALADRVELNIFILHPCEAYWGDLKRSDSQKDDELVNPLLASMGRLGRDFANLLLEYDHVCGSSTELYEPLAPTTMLQQLQGDILALQCNPLPPALLEDGSIRIHSCHSKMREIEVLHDSMLAMFEELPGLQPRDILVMTPDIDAYAPYIAAVFEAEHDPARRIPFTVADRSIMADSRCATAFLSLLAIGESRFEAPLIMDILAVPEVAAAFAVSPAELVLIRSWLEATRIRWGLDGEHRASLGLPCYGEQSWQAGIDRLLLGIAMPDEGQLFAGTLPFDAMEGESVATLGKLTRFLEPLSDLAGQAATALTVAGWRGLCTGILEKFFSERQPGDSQLSALREALDVTCRAPVDAGFTETIAPGLFRSMLTADLAKRRKGLGFMTGGVTFCAMLPMRSIPFRVIAMIGMNDAMFPRRDRSSSFDLISARPLPGDRSLRNEDRYLFLESLISARELLHISYIGQGERDNAVYPPSVLVSELLDYLQSSLSETERQSSSLVTRHRLQPFSRAYFSRDSRLFSYSEENYRGLLSAVARTGAPAGFCPEPLPPVDDDGPITIDALVRFFSNPAAAFLAARLGVRIEEFRSGVE